MTADLVATGSIPVLEAPATGADLVTEVVAGERLRVLNAVEEWLEVIVPGHATRLDPRGYPGWIRAGRAVEVPGWAPDVMVASENSAGLPLGALLMSSERGARLPGGGVVEVPGEALRPSGEPCGRSVIEVCETLLGLPYRWGGTDSTSGMDCSGMAYRVMQVLGVTLPRDARDQYDRAPFRTRESWMSARAGDLVFFGEESVTHVGFYLGGGRYVSEHGAGGTIIRDMDEDPYWGFARYA